MDFWLKSAGVFKKIRFHAEESEYLKRGFEGERIGRMDFRRIGVRGIWAICRLYKIIGEHRVEVLSDTNFYWHGIR